LQITLKSLIIIFIQYHIKPSLADLNERETQLTITSSWIGNNDLHQK